MMIVELLLFGLLFQGILAAFVYQDAYQRGDDEGLWTVVTLLFGVIGVLLYLLQRPDEHLSDDERERSASTLGLRVVALYTGSLVVGGFIAFVGAGVYLEQVNAPNGNVVFFPLLCIPPIVLFLYRNRGRVIGAVPP